MPQTRKTISASDAFISYLHECNMRVTRERLTIIEAIARHSGLFSIDKLEGDLRRGNVAVSTASVYNTIGLLLDAGIVKCLRLADRPTALYRLDMGEAPRIYMVCEQCGAVKEKTSKTLTRYISNYDFTSFWPETFTLTVYGLCRKCRKSAKRT